MRNRYPGTCYRCSEWVPAGEGHFERLGCVWRVQHANCAIEHRGTQDEARAAYDLNRTRMLAQKTGRVGNRGRKKLTALNGDSDNG